MVRFVTAFLEALGALGAFITVHVSLSSAQDRVRTGYWRAQLQHLGSGSLIHKHVVMHNPDKIWIGDRVAIAEFVHIWGGGQVIIKDNAIIASHAVITSLTHDKYAAVFRDTNMRAPVVICENCWIGAGAIILPGVKIGEGSIVGSQAVVVQDVPARSVVVGVPARIIEKLP